MHDRRAEIEPTFAYTPWNSGITHTWLCDKAHAIPKEEKTSKTVEKERKLD